MRLWHSALIAHLDCKRLLGQHRECCALRGKGWGKKHSTVDYVFKHSPGWLFEFHTIVIGEMFRRGYAADVQWLERLYRGRSVHRWSLIEACDTSPFQRIYPEHNDKYLKECLMNLKSKNAELVNGKTIDEWLIELDLKI